MKRDLDHIVVATRDLQALTRRYEALGFTLTPLSSHNDEMGTSNQLIQLSDHAFIELLEVDRPERILPHDMESDRPFFSFGAHNLAFLKDREGASVLMFKSTDVVADAHSLARVGFDTYAPYFFSRRSVQLDGSELGVAFRLGFFTHTDMPDITFCLCENHYPENFWKPDFAKHDNGAQRFSAIYLCAREPHRYRKVLAAVTGDPGYTTQEGGLGYDLGIGQCLYVLKPDWFQTYAPVTSTGIDRGPVLTGFRLNRVCHGNDNWRVTPPDAAGGPIILWGNVSPDTPG